MTENSLRRELDNLVNNYMKIYDEYYSTNSRDSAFLKDLTDTILGISAVLEVYARDGKIYPSYALEKLKHNLRLIAHYPEEVIWEPIFRIYHFVWRRFRLWK